MYVFLAYIVIHADYPPLHQTPTFHPTDEDLSVGTPASLWIDPEKSASVMDSGSPR